MSQQTVVRPEPATIALQGRPRAIARADAPRAAAAPRWFFWPLEFLRVLGVALLFPVVILAVGLPLALAVSGLVLGAQWLWQLLT